ncbi:MAG: hypothetical protein ABH846_04655 [Patescibacteria group bacterium]
MLKKHGITFYIIFIGVVSTVLLVGNRFEVIWAGGEGVAKHQLAMTDDANYKRGEIIKTDDDQWLRVHFGQADFWLYENTQVKLIDGRDDHLTINVLQGRVVVIGPLMIEVRELDIIIDGTASYVHYSWLDEIEVASINGEVLIKREDRTIGLNEQALKTTTLPPYMEETIQFDPESSEAANFYAQALAE